MRTYSIDSPQAKSRIIALTLLVRILVKLATNNASKLAGDNASTCPLQKELQAES